MNLEDNNLENKSSEYKKDNIFAQILRQELAADKIYENEHTVVIKDINPQAFIHNLVLPKGEYVDMRNFLQNASVAEKLAFLDAISNQLDAIVGGARIVINIGATARQQVFHLHAHVMGFDKK
jgi:diadenosine tetraphosphate (Ap4A) HIT family hydrolase